jgi:hypothetical protein
MFQRRDKFRRQPAMGDENDAYHRQALSRGDDQRPRRG